VLCNILIELLTDLVSAIQVAL